MSFGDLSRGGARSSSGAPSRDPIAQLGQSLQSLQRDCLAVKESITSMRRRKVGPAEKTDLDVRIRSVRETESRLGNQLDGQLRLLEKMPRTEAAPKRTAVGKLQKDFERIKMNVQALSSEASLIKVSQELAGKESFARVGGGAGSSGGAGRRNTPSSGNIFDERPPLPPEEQQQQQQFQTKSGLQIQNMLQDREIDEAIMAERERDIKKLNNDIRLVNEMFQDMAQIVDKQGEHIDEIAKSTEISHERAQGGLDQVKKAATYQPTCAIC